MATNGHNLAPNKMKALVALLEHPTITAAAQAAGVGQRTLTRWMTEDVDFQRALIAAQTRVLNRTIALLSAAAPMAVAILLEIASDSNQSSSVRVQAASKILSEMRAGHSTIIQKNEIEELKRAVHELEEGN